jgi:hypothetical protein
LLCYRSNRFERIAFSFAHPDEERVNGVCVDSSGTVWAATHQGPGVVDGKRLIIDSSFSAYIGKHSPNPTQETSAIQVDRGGTVLVSDRAGLQRVLLRQACRGEKF